jgi:hypothetical protein
MELKSLQSGKLEEKMSGSVYLERGIPEDQEDC